MRKRVFLLALAAASLAVTTLSAQVPPVMRILTGGQPGSALPPQARPGEKFRFSVGYLGVTGARAAVSVEAQGTHGTMLTADVENTALLRFIFRIRDRYQASLDERGATLNTRLWQDETGTQRYREETFFDDRVVTMERVSRAEKVRNVPVVTRPMDPLSSLFWVRGQQLREGDTITTQLFANNRVFEARVKVLGRQNVTALSRSWNAVRLHAEFLREGQPVQGVGGSFWVSDDGDRIPLKGVAETPYGKVTFTLVGMER